MPPDERVGPDRDEGLAPLELEAQRGHDPAGGVVGSMGFDLAFLKQSELFSEEQVLGRESAA